MQIDGDITRKNLISIISQNGQSILNDPKKIKNLLSDLNQGAEKKYVNIICSSLDDKVPFELLKNNDNLPYNISSEHAVQHLQDNFGITNGLAKWTVDTWGMALNIIPRTSNKTQTNFEKETPVTKTRFKSIQGKSHSFKRIDDFYIPPISAQHSINKLHVSISKNQITGKYEQNKFVRWLAIICFAISFFLILIFPNANVGASEALNRIIAWSALILCGIFFVLLAAYGGYIFRIET
jgi:hypothetical protein